MSAKNFVPFGSGLLAESRKAVPQVARHHGPLKSLAIDAPPLERMTVLEKFARDGR